MEKREKEIALNLIKAGLDNETISKSTSLTIRQIEQLRKQQSKMKQVQSTTHPDWLDQSEYPFESHYFELPTGKMHYVDEGTNDPIVMVHGNPG